MHNKLQAKLLLDSTLENLDSHQLTPTPNNYRIWFEYAAGGIENLTAEIDGMVTQQNTITEAICQQLYTRHLATNDQRDVDDTRIAIGDMLNVMIGHLKGWDSTSTHFCDALAQCLEKLNNDPSVHEIKDIVCTITEQAKKVHDANVNIKSTLHNLSDEISALRQDIDRLGNDALTDDLTQTANRRGFDSALKDAIKEDNGGLIECALIVADVDNFKRVNDNFGHQVGDKILKFIAATLRKNIRGHDTLARYGGEEFAIVLPHTRYEGAMQVAENLRKAVSSRQLTTGSNGKTIGRITISIGVSTYRQGETMESFFERTDKSMYQAKQQGKDQVVGQQD